MELEVISYINAQPSLGVIIMNPALYPDSRVVSPTFVPQRALSLLPLTEYRDI